MSHASPARHATPARRREVARIAIATIVTAGAIGYILTDLEHFDPAAAARLATAVSLVMVSHWLVERRLNRRLEALEERRARVDYWRVYADVLDDLGGLDGETSTDHGHLPRR